MVDGVDSSGASRASGHGTLGDLRRRIAWAVHRACPHWLAQERDDLIQSASLRVLDLAHRGEIGAEPPTSYVLKVAHSVVLDEIRRRDRQRGAASFDAGSPEEDAMHGATRSGHSGAQHDAREIGRAILECLSRLVAARRRAVTLYLLGHSVPETAERLALDYKQASNLVFRGLADLRRCLGAKGVTP